METEKKWLIEIDSIPYNLSELKSFEIEQKYISYSPTIRIRNIDGKEYILTVKSKASGLSGYSRIEYEIPITKNEYDSLSKKSEGNIISKTRYINKRSDGLTEEIDIFKDNLKGLAYLEIEFSDEESLLNFKDPDWVKKDVSQSKGYSNADLAEFGMPKLL